MSTTRRKSLVAKPSFQIKLTIIFMLMVTIVANLVGGLCFFFLSSAEARGVLARLATSPDYPEGIPVLEMAQLFIPKILVAEGISLVIVFMLCIWVTHTIAGPLYRMERVAAEIAEGDLSLFTRLRPKDELKELADAFNYMSRGLAKRIFDLHDAVGKLETSGDVKDGVRSMRATLDTFRLPDRAFVDSPLPSDEEEGDDDEAAETPAGTVAAPAFVPGEGGPGAQAAVPTSKPSGSTQQPGNNARKKKKRR
jgi:HAMP domain-containing protein